MKINEWHNIFFAGIKYVFYDKNWIFLSKEIILFVVIRNECFQELSVGDTKNG